MNSSAIVNKRKEADKRYYEKNRQKRYESVKRVHQQNPELYKEKYKEYMKKYLSKDEVRLKWNEYMRNRAKSKKVTCQCGATVQNIHQHLKSKKHLNNLVVI